MPPGGPPLGDNRFALLSTSPKAKRKKPSLVNNFPTLPSIKKENPKYLVASAVNSEKPLSKYSCFAVHKALKNISSEIINISELRDGKLLLFVKNDHIAQKFLATNTLFGICDVKIELHNNLNYTKGTIFAPCLNDIPDNEIVENLSEQGVVSIFKFPKYINNQAVPSGVVLLTFDYYHLPEKIDVSWYTTKVRPYYPNPMRCKSCQLLGHTTKRGTKAPVCEACALPPHSTQPCSRSFCINCSGSHSASSKSCPKFMQMKEIITIKTDNKCSMREAIKKHKMRVPPTLNETSTSFANVAKNNNNTIQTNNSPIQNTLPEQTSSRSNNNVNSTNDETKENKTTLNEVNMTTNTSVDDSTTHNMISSLLSHLTSPALTSSLFPPAPIIDPSQMIE